MALAHREATVVWQGSLGGGAGTLREGGALGETPVDWASTEEQADGTTSPEQLLAAAEAGCYAMTLALALARRGHKADELRVSAACELDRADGDDPHEYRVTRIDLDVHARVDDLGEEEFVAIAKHADEQCPISAAVRGNVDVRVSATLDG